MQGGKSAGGFGFIYAGLVFLFVASVINLLQGQPGYNEWFLESVYGWFSILETILIITGAVFFVIGLVIYLSFWGDRDIEVSNHLEKLRLLDNIQQESRFPFPVMELLDRVLRSMLGGLDEQSGAIFLLDRSQRKFILATSSGLSKEEISLLEYYPYGRNIVTQAIEEESPVISSDFRSLGGKAQIAGSRFRSIMVAPLVSGKSKLGAIAFFSTEDKHFTREFISIISPIAEWLAEKIEVNRLSRDLGRAKRQIETTGSQFKTLAESLENIIGKGDIPRPTAFAERCVGLADSDEVWLLGLVDGRLNIFGGSESRPDFSENFRSALIDAISKKKALILNQEATDSEGNKFIARASLLMPIGSTGNAILLRNNNGQVSARKNELQAFEIIASVAGMVIENSQIVQISRSRSKGLKLLGNILNIKTSPANPEPSIRTLADHLRDDFQDYSFIIFERDREKLSPVFSNMNLDNLDELEMEIGEASTGKAAALRNPSILSEHEQIARNLSEMNEENRNTFYAIFDERQPPSFWADYPIIINGETRYLLTVFSYGENSAVYTEQHRLMQLMIGMLNLRFDIATARTEKAAPPPVVVSESLTGERLNEINNSLSAISGYCQLAKQNPNLSGDIERAFSSIQKLSEDLADNLKKQVPPEPPAAIPETKKQTADLNDTIREIFVQNSISGNLHMIEGRPVAVNLRLKNIPALFPDKNELNRFINSACRAFSENVEEDEILSINTYSGEDAVYIDLSKHRENFPPVEPVIGFGNYITPESARDRIKDAEFLDFLNNRSGEFAYDRHSRRPSYFSLRLPIKEQPVEKTGTELVSKPITVLAVDDQAVILDLLAAMCQSLGYTIYTARDGVKGWEIFQSKNPDIVISDLAMPGLSGWELASKVKAESPQIPFVIITGWGTTIDESRMAQSGVDHVLHKPFRLEQLSELISKLVQSRVKG